MSDPNALAQIADLEISISDRSLLNFGIDDDEPIVASAVPVNNTATTNNNNNTSTSSLAMAMDQFESGTSSPPQSPPRLSAAEYLEGRAAARLCQANNSNSGGGNRSEDLERSGSTTSNMSKDSARSSVSFQLEPRSAPDHSSTIASAVAMDNYPVATERNTFDYRMSGSDDDAAVNHYYPQSSLPAVAPSQTTSNRKSSSNKKKKGGKKKKKGVLKNNNNSKSPISNNSRPLTMVSAQYDFENKGYLDPTQAAMRARDTSNTGHLDHSTVYQIVQEQLSAHSLMNTYKKIIIGLLCLVLLLALSNFGTSWAAAILTKDTVASGDTNTVNSKESGEVMGFQAVGYTYELDVLTEEEFRQRRKLVDDAIEADPDHEDHAHRRLGKNNNKNKKNNNKCNCSKIAYDRNKISERDLQDITRRCDGINTVNVVRRFRDRDGTPTGADYDQVCGPGTVVIKKKKKKRNKKGDKVKVVNERVTFRQQGKNKNRGDNDNNGRMKDLHFECEGGSCYTSGEHLHQRAGHPCNPDRDRTDASECIEGLFCHDPDGYGSGVCTRPERYSFEDQACNMAFGVDACESGYSCKCSGNKEDCKRYKDEPNFIDLRIGYCARVNERVRDRDICDARHGNKACDDGYMCLGSNGEELRGRGLGICTRLAKQQRQYDVCDLSYGGESCQREYYCQDRNRGRNNFGGNNNNNGLGIMHQGATISGPSGSTSTGNLGYNNNRSNRGKDYVARTAGTGVCMRSTGLGRSCGTDEECGHGYSCIGLGNGNNANAGTGGSISGPSGSISWGNNGAAARSRSGFCG